MSAAFVVFLPTWVSETSVDQVNRNAECSWRADDRARDRKVTSRSSMGDMEIIDALGVARIRCDAIASTFACRLAFAQLERANERIDLLPLST